MTVDMPPALTSSYLLCPTVRPPRPDGDSDRPVDRNRIERGPQESCEDLRYDAHAASQARPDSEGRDRLGGRQRRASRPPSTPPRPLANEPVTSSPPPGAQAHTTPYVRPIPAEHHGTSRPKCEGAVPVDHSVASLNTRSREPPSRGQAPGQEFKPHMTPHQVLRHSCVKHASRASDLRQDIARNAHSAHNAHSAKPQVRRPLRQAQGSRRTPHDGSSETGRTPAASAPCSRPRRSTPGPAPAPPGRRPRTRSCVPRGPRGA